MTNISASSECMDSTLASFANDPYAWISQACDQFLGTIKLAPSEDPLFFVWKMGRHVDGLQGIESMVHSAAQMIGLFEEEDTKNQYRRYVREGLDSANDWKLAFLLLRFLVWASSKSNDGNASTTIASDGAFAHARDAWRIELCHAYADACQRRGIDWCTFVHMTQFPVLPVVLGSDDTMLDMLLPHIFPTDFVSMHHLRSMPFVPLSARIDAVAMRALHLGVELEQSFAQAWSTVRAIREGALEEIGLPGEE